MRRARDTLALIALLLCAAGRLPAQEDLPVPEVPPTLPLAARDRLGTARAELVAEVEAHNRKVSDFLSRCGQVPAANTALVAACGREYQAMSGAASAIVDHKRRFTRQVAAAVNADAPCAALASQLERDKQALRIQQKTIELGVRELDAWADANAKAQQDAVGKGVSLLLTAGTLKLEQKENAARNFKGWMTRYKDEMIARRIPVREAMEKMEHVFAEYQSARSHTQLATLGRQLKRFDELKEHWEAFKTETGVIANIEAESDSNIQAALADPTFQRYVKEDATGRDFLRTMLDLASSTPGFKKISPAYALASFAVDYGYDVRSWIESRQRILDQNKLSDRELEAVDKLKQQIERTMGKLKACRSE